MGKLKDYYYSMNEEYTHKEYISAKQLDFLADRGYLDGLYKKDDYDYEELDVINEQ